MLANGVSRFISKQIWAEIVTFLANNTSVGIAANRSIYLTTALIVLAAGAGCFELFAMRRE